MVIYLCRPAMVQSFVALGRDCQFIISTCEFYRSHSICNCVWRSNSRISHVPLPEQRRFRDCGLHFRFVRVLALSRFFRGIPEYLSRRFAEHFYDVVLRNILRRMFEKNEVDFSAACSHGPVGQFARRILAWPSYCWHFLRRGIAQTRLGEFQNLWFRGGRLLYRDTCQSPWLAYLPRLGDRVGPLLSGLHHRVVALLSEYSRAGEHSWHHIHFSVRCV